MIYYPLKTDASDGYIRSQFKKNHICLFALVLKLIHKSTYNISLTVIHYKRKSVPNESLLILKCRPEFIAYHKFVRFHSKCLHTCTYDLDCGIVNTEDFSIFTKHHRRIFHYSQKV